MMANAPNMRFNAWNVRAIEPNGGAGLPKEMSNGKVEGPPRSADQAPQAHTVFLRPRRGHAGRSRCPPRILRGSFGIESNLPCRNACDAY